jgi:hypothetical protein
LNIIDIVYSTRYDDYFDIGVVMPAAAERKLARDSGETRFFTGRPCKHGHIAHRYTCSGVCSACVSERAKERTYQPRPLEERKQTLARWNASTKGYQAKLRWKEKDPKNAWACSAAGGARIRSKKFGLVCDVDKSYIRSIITDVCPVFGTPFVWYGNNLNALSPSLDRIIPSLGYVKGNVVVISVKANAIKSNATLQEIEMVANWLKTVT